MKKRSKYIEFDYSKISNSVNRENLTVLVDEFLKSGESISRAARIDSLELLNIIFYDQSSDLTAHNSDIVSIFVSRSIDDEVEEKLYLMGYNDVLDLKLVTNKGFKRMVTSNYFKALSELKNRSIQEKINHASRLNALGLLAGGIAHELNNPLTALKGYIYKLKKLSNSDRLIVDKLDAIADRMAKIVGGIRNFSRDGSQENSEYISPVEILDYVLGFMEGILENKGIRLKVQNGLAPDFRCWISRSQMEGMFQNLISNAADSIDNDNGAIEIKLFQTLSKQYHIVIKDNGQGMSEEVSQRIFDPFYTTKELGKGTGLGMGMIIDSIKIHKGEINVSSQVGFGTTISMIFPVDRRPNRENQIETSKVTSANKGVIALIDDDLSVGEALCDVFNNDFDLEYFQDPVDFINSDYSKYSLIITDLVMPKVDGYDLARQVKGARPNIPIWLLTTDRKLSRLKTTKETPFDLILSKPIIDFELLKEKIEKLFSSITQD
jgi:signal transduction histidine kinase